MARRFLVEKDVLDLGVRVRGAFGYGLNNHDYPTGLRQWLEENGKKILERLSPAAIANDEILKGFRDIHAKIGKTGKRWISSPENMISQILKMGRIPTINPLVDIYNMISLKTSLALGAQDLAHVEGNISLRLLNGSEHFVPLGAARVESVQAGEYGYCDDGNDVLCRLEVRQVEKTKVTQATRDCFFIIQGNQASNDALLDAAALELGEVLTRFLGGRYEQA